MTEAQERPLYEVNKWGQIVPLNFVSLSIYGQCINALICHFQYPQYFSVFIGNYLLCSTDHFTKEQVGKIKDLEKVMELQVLAREIIQFGWNQENSNSRVAIGELETLLQTLCTMSHVSKQVHVSHEPLSTVCSMAENQWIQQSVNMMRSAFQACMDQELVFKCVVPAAQGNYEAYLQNQVQWYSWLGKRFQGVLNNFGSFDLNLNTFQTVCMCLYAKAESFDNVKEQIEWLRGDENPRRTFDEMMISHIPATDCYKGMVHVGAFVHRKRDQLRFKEIYVDLKKILKDDNVAHLLLMSILFNSDETQTLQNLYQHLLVKKLAEICSDFGGENGDHMLCLLRGLFKEYIELIGRQSLEIEKDIQAGTGLNEDK